jgi:hypothetical protein
LNCCPYLQRQSAAALRDRPEREGCGQCCGNMAVAAAAGLTRCIVACILALYVVLGGHHTCDFYGRVMRPAGAVMTVAVNACADNDAKIYMI